MNTINSPQVDFGDFETNQYGTIVSVDTKRSFVQTPLSYKDKNLFSINQVSVESFDEEPIKPKKEDNSQKLR